MYIHVTLALRLSHTHTHTYILRRVSCLYSPERAAFEPRRSACVCVYIYSKKEGREGLKRKIERGNCEKANVQKAEKSLIRLLLLLLQLSRLIHVEYAESCTPREGESVCIIRSAAYSGRVYIYKVAAAARPLEPRITNVLNGISAQMKYSNKKAGERRVYICILHLLSRILLTPSRVRAFLLRSSPVFSYYSLFFYGRNSNARVKVCLYAHQACIYIHVYKRWAVGFRLVRVLGRVISERARRYMYIYLYSIQGG